MEETALPIGKLLKLAAARRQHGAAYLDVLPAAALPAALGCGQGIGIKVVLGYDICLGRRFAVVPEGGDGAGQLRTALLSVIDVTLVDAYQVGEDVEVVDVVVAAVDVGHA